MNICHADPTADAADLDDGDERGYRHRAGEHGHVVGTLLSGGLAKPMYEAYRKRARELGWEAGPDRMAYAAIVGVGNTSAEGLRRANIIADYVRTARWWLNRLPIHRATTRSGRMWRC